MTKLNNKSLILIFVIADITMKLGKFLVIPVLLFYLSPTEFGQLEFYLSYAAFFSSFLGPGLQNWLISNGRDEVTKTFFSTLALYFRWFLCIFVVTFVVSVVWNNYLLLALLLYSFSNSIYLFLVAYVKILQKYKLYVVSVVILVGLDLAIIYAFLALDFGFMSRFLGSLIAFFVSLMATYFLLERRFRYYEYKSAKLNVGEAARFFMPFFFLGLSGFFTTSYAKILVANDEGFVRLASMGLALQVLSMFKLASDAVVKTVNSVFIPALDSHDIVVTRFYMWSFGFIAAGYLLLLALYLLQQEIELVAYPTLLEDLALFTPSRVIMVLNLYASILVTTLLGSKILFYISIWTLVAYLFGLPMALKAGGVPYIANFDFFYNASVFIFYSCFLLVTLNLENRRLYWLCLLTVLIFMFGFLRFL